MAIDIGRLAFEAYSASTNNKTYDGRDIPKWEDVGQQVQNAWRAAACAVHNYSVSEYQKLIFERLAPLILEE